MIRRTLGCLLAIVVLALPTLGAGQSLPLDAQALTEYVVTRIRDRAAETQIRVQVTILRPLSIKLDLSSQMGVETNLAQLHAHCLAVEGRCADVVERMAELALKSFSEATRPAEKERLRLLVRSSRFVEELNLLQQRRGRPPVVARHYVGELWTVVAMDGAGLIGFATSETLKELGLDEAGAFDLALKNTRLAKSPVNESALPLRGTYYQALTGDGYESSRLVMHADWAEVAKTRRGDLIVSVPASNVIIFGWARSDEQLKDLQDVAVQQFRKAQVGITAQLFRWRAEGWEVLKEPATPPSRADARVERPPPADVNPVTSDAPSFLVF